MLTFALIKAVFEYGGLAGVFGLFIISEKRYLQKKELTDRKEEIERYLDVIVTSFKEIVSEKIAAINSKIGRIEKIIDDNMVFMPKKKTSKAQDGGEGKLQ